MKLAGESEGAAFSGSPCGTEALEVPGLGRGVASPCPPVNKGPGTRCGFQRYGTRGSYERLTNAGKTWPLSSFQWAPRVELRAFASGDLQAEGAVGQLLVVVLDVDAEEGFELAAAGDHEPVEAPLGGRCRPSAPMCARRLSPRPAPRAET